MVRPHELHMVIKCKKTYAGLHKNRFVDWIKAMAFHVNISEKMNLLIYCEGYLLCKLRAIFDYAYRCASSLSTACDSGKQSVCAVGRISGLRTARLSGALFVAILPVGTIAAPPAKYEQISFPGKTILAYRPLAQRKRVVGKCHPEGSKAIACEAQAAIARKEALVAKEASSLPDAGRAHEDPDELLH